MSNDCTLLWDAIYDELNGDATLRTLLGGANRIGRPSMDSKVDYKAGSYLAISDIESISQMFQGDTGNVIITAWASLAEDPANIQKRVSDLLIGFTPLTWTQQMTRSTKQGTQFVTGDDLFFGRDTYKIPHEVL